MKLRTIKRLTAARVLHEARWRAELRAELMIEDWAMGNYLMKLASVTGCLMANAEGADIAFDRLLGTAQFVLRTMPKKPATLRPIQ